MPPLSDIGKYKRLAELLVITLRVTPAISAKRNAAALNCLIEHGLSEHEAESFLDEAFGKFENGMIRSPEKTLADVNTFFRRRQHAFILSQIQAILEAGDISDNCQTFFDLCCEYLYNPAKAK